jgi:hypothetical protein
MEKMTVQKMLQVGYDCDLVHIEEAYSMITSHYDVFFLIENLQQELQEFFELLKNADLLTDTGHGYEFKDLTLIEAAEIIGYKLTKFELPLFEGNNGDLEDFV